MRTAAREGAAQAQEALREASARCEAAAQTRGRLNALVEDARATVEQLGIQGAAVGEERAARIVAAVSAGAIPPSIDTSPDWEATHAAAVAELRSLEAALQLLDGQRAELEAAEKRAVEDLNIALDAVNVEDAREAIEQGRRALAELQRVRRVLFGVERIGSRVGPQGFRPFPMPSAGYELMGEIPPAGLHPLEVGPIVEEWRVYRAALATDPDAKAPEGEAPKLVAVAMPGQGATGPVLFRTSDVADRGEAA